MIMDSTLKTALRKLEIAKLRFCKEVVKEIKKLFKR